VLGLIPFLIKSRVKNVDSPPPPPTPPEGYQLAEDVDQINAIDINQEYASAPNE